MGAEHRTIASSLRATRIRPLENGNAAVFLPELYVMAVDQLLSQFDGRLVVFAMQIDRQHDEFTVPGHDVCTIAHCSLRPRAYRARFHLQQRPAATGCRSPHALLPYFDNSRNIVDSPSQLWHTRMMKL